jgi:hypothetical protein
MYTRHVYWLWQSEVAGGHVGQRSASRIALGSIVSDTTMDWKRTGYKILFSPQRPTKTLPFHGVNGLLYR